VSCSCCYALASGPTHELALCMALCQVAESKDGAEVISVDRALRAIRRAEVVVSVIDAAEGITQQVRAVVHCAPGWCSGSRQAAAAWWRCQFNCLIRAVEAAAWLLEPARGVRLNVCACSHDTGLPPDRDGRCRGPCRGGGGQQVGQGARCACSCSAAGTEEIQLSARHSACLSAQHGVPGCVSRTHVGES
jgi:hypothetical protein